MNQEAAQTLRKRLVLFVADASQPPNEDDHLLSSCSALKRPATVILALNKLDAISTESFGTQRRISTRRANGFRHPHLGNTATIFRTCSKRSWSACRKGRPSSLKTS
jgi:GTPase Era involved in 16S rRNA processing